MTLNKEETTIINKLEKTNKILLEADKITNKSSLNKASNNLASIDKVLLFVDKSLNELSELQTNNNLSEKIMTRISSFEVTIETPKFTTKKHEQIEKFNIEKNLKEIKKPKNFILTKTTEKAISKVENLPFFNLNDNKLNLSISNIFYKDTKEIVELGSSDNIVNYKKL